MSVPAPWEQLLVKWQDAGLIDPAAASRIREFEGSNKGSGGLRWPAIAAIALGAIMLAAGVLLFVSAHWDDLAPSTRFAMVVLMVAVFHAGGAFASKMPALATALHGIGTATLGAGIYLSGQIFNMNEHWPTGILLWAMGALFGLALRHDWVQLSFLAILAPAWLGAEWVDGNPAGDQLIFRVLSTGMLLLAITYFTDAHSSALVWIGGIALLPWALALALSREVFGTATGGGFLAYAVACALPLAAAAVMRGKGVWMNVIAAAWVLVLNIVSRNYSPWLYLWCGLGAAGMVAWGMHERRTERINLGMAGFAITILFFYFSSLMDKLGRSASLIGLGILFLAGGWALEKLRRKLVSQMRQAA